MVHGKESNHLDRTRHISNLSVWPSTLKFNMVTCMASQTGKFSQTWFRMTKTMVSVAQTMVLCTQTLVSHQKQSFMFGNHGLPTGTELFLENMVRGSQTMFWLTLIMISYPKQSYRNRVVLGKHG